MGTGFWFAFLHILYSNLVEMEKPLFACPSWLGIPLICPIPAQVLELLWDLAHLPALSTPLVEQALAEHLAILIDSNIVKEQVKKSYVVKCVDDIKEVLIQQYYLFRCCTG